MHVLFMVAFPAPALAACGSAAVLSACCAAASAAPALPLSLTILVHWRQVPRDVSEDALRPFFEPYGEIEHINILRTHRGQSAGAGCCSACAAVLPAYLQAERAGPVGACLRGPCSLRWEHFMLDTASLMQHLQEGPPVATSSFRASPLHARRCGTLVSRAPVRHAQAARSCSSASGARQRRPWRRTMARRGWATLRCRSWSSLQTQSGRTAAPGRHAPLSLCATGVCYVPHALPSHSLLSSVE